MKCSVTTGLSYQFKKRTLPVVCSLFLTVFAKPKKSSPYLSFLLAKSLQQRIDTS
ncbi:hypothetical protein [Aliarcobacter vitoriensis]|uniref:hypothetical protein n=1 Tax=Aliarcobacter vitoriensis TaxID=2011099 RepID=UPI00211D93D7|nr:hypothetical protein [Aliarcobacter vitoriensis]